MPGGIDCHLGVPLPPGSVATPRHRRGDGAGSGPTVATRAILEHRGLSLKKLIAQRSIRHTWTQEDRASAKAGRDRRGLPESDEKSVTHTLCVCFNYRVLLRRLVVLL